MKRGPKPKGPPGHPYYELGGTVRVTREMHDLAKRRVGGLTAWSEVSCRSLSDLLANAYLLGLQDAADSFARQPALEQGGQS